MRILFLNYEYPPIGGGGANATAYLFRELENRQDVQIDCVTSAVGSQDSLETLADNIRLHRLAVGKGQLHYWTQREVLTWLLRATRKVNTLMREQQYDVCHAFFGFPSGLVAWRLRKKLPYMVSLRGSDVPGFNPRFAAQYVLLKPLFRRIWTSAGSIVANSLGLQKLANRFLPDLPIAVIPNGIDAREFHPATEGEPVPGRILCVSRLVERKGVQDLIEAMPGILKKIPHAHLVIAGEGDLLETLQARCRELAIADKTDFQGYVAHDDLPQLYRAAELFVQPSFYEGMSNTVLEAMACGLPIIATGEGGREELLKDNAMITQYNDPAALAESVSKILSNTQKMKVMGQISRQIAEQYSWAAVAQSYLSIYHDLIESRPASRVPRNGF
jgi:glycosyltransferase involved in cell wall biosynthesis